MTPDTHSSDRPSTSKTWLLIPLFLILIAGSAFTWRTIWQAGYEMRKDLFLKAEVVAQTINLERIKTLSFDETDREKFTYKRLSEQLGSYANLLRSTWSPAKNYVGIYTMIERDGNIVFGPESIPATDPMSSAPGTTYKAPPLEFKKAFDEGKPAVVGPYTDEYGSFVSVIFPVLDPITGNVSVTIGIDIMSEDWQLQRLIAATTPLSISFLLIIILIVGRILLVKRNKYDAQKRWRFRHIEAALVLAFGITLTLVAVIVNDHREKRDHFEEFSDLATIKTDKIREGFHNFRDIELESLARFFESSNQVTEEEFQTYTGYLSKKAAIEAWGFLPTVSEKNKAAFEKQMSDLGSKNFMIWEKDENGKIIPARPRPLYFPLAEVAPLKGNEHVLGFDLNSEAHRRSAINESIISGLVTASDPVVLANDRNDLLGTVVFRPVFDKHDHQTIQGFVTAGLRFETLLDVAVGNDLGASYNTQTVVDLYQLQDGTPVKLLASTGKINEEPAFPLSDSFIRPIFAFGKSYGAVVRPSSKTGVFSALSTNWIVGGSGIAITFILAIMIGFVVNRREELERVVKERTADLRESTERLGATLYSIGDAVVSTDEKGCIVDMNPVAEDLTKWKLSEAKGFPLDNIFNIVNAKTREKAVNPVHQVLAEDIVVNLANDTILVARDGSERQIADSAAPIHDANGKITGTVLVFRDVTEEYRAKEEMRRAVDMKSNFTSMVSHELRTPLSIIIEGVKLVSDGSCGPLSEEQKKYLDTAERNADRLGRLINDVLDLQKFDAGMMKFNMQENDINKIALEVKSSMETLAAKNGLKLESQIDETIPKFKFDADRITQVVTNLLNNSLKFTEKGKIIISTGIHDNQVIVSVTDTGTGIKQEDLPKLFNKFTQILTGKHRKTGGSGLGLAICKEIVIGHGGKIWAESKFEEGTKISFTLPLSTNGVSHV